MDNIIWVAMLSFLAGMVVTLIAIWLIIRNEIKRMLANIDNAVEYEADAVVEADVEFDQNMFFLYNRKNGNFMAQGKDLEELKTHIAQRFKDIEIKIVGGDVDAVKKLKTQVGVNESSNSI